MMHLEQPCCLKTSLEQHERANDLLEMPDKKPIAQIALNSQACFALYWLFLARSLLPFEESGEYMGSVTI